MIAASLFVFFSASALILRAAPYVRLVGPPAGGVVQCAVHSAEACVSSAKVAQIKTHRQARTGEAGEIYFFIMRPISPDMPNGLTNMPVSRGRRRPTLKMAMSGFIVGMGVACFSGEIVRQTP